MSDRLDLDDPDTLRRLLDGALPGDDSDRPVLRRNLEGRLRASEARLDRVRRENAEWRAARASRRSAESVREAVESIYSDPYAQRY